MFHFQNEIEQKITETRQRRRDSSFIWSWKLRRMISNIRCIRGGVRLVEISETHTHTQTQRAKKKESPDLVRTYL